MFRRGGGQRGDLSALLNRAKSKPSKWERFWNSPALFLARVVYDWHQEWNTPQAPFFSEGPQQLESNTSLPVVVVRISDTHNKTSSRIPTGDILIHAGDLSQNGSVDEVQKMLDWLNEQPHAHKIVIAGNHDTCLESSEMAKDAMDISTTAAPPPSLQWGSITYLQDSSTTVQIRGRELHIFGSPRTPGHGNGVFQYARAAGASVWQPNKIPQDTDILITHGPPRGHLDLGRAGCEYLLKALWRLPRKPRLHVFGHIHEGYGRELLAFDKVQVAYEDVVSANNNNTHAFWGLCRLLCHFCCSTVYWYCCNHQVLATSYTVLVNAAQVGGLRDNLARPPVTVII